MSRQLTLPTLESLEAQAIRVLRENEPKEGYILAFSGGKDSIVIYDLAKKAGVKFEAHYHVTTIDPPELTRFIKREFPDVIWDRPKKPFFKVMVEKGIPPLRKRRWCCEIFKERNFPGRVVILGIRTEESAKRKTWKQVDIHRRTKEQMILPIVNWPAEELWEYINDNNLKYCSLYDEGFHRLGCVMCPAATSKMKRDATRWPQFEKLWRRAFVKLHAKRKIEKPESVARWKDGDEMFEWWLKG